MDTTPEAECNDAFNLRTAIDEAKRRADRSHTNMRIFRAYGAYCVKADTLPFDGTTIGFCTATDWFPVEQVRAFGR